jgi:hypothetical protein
MDRGGVLLNELLKSEREKFSAFAERRRPDLITSLAEFNGKWLVASGAARLSAIRAHGRQRQDGKSKSKER